MTTYEFRCRACESTFTVKRPMAQSSDPASCPDGHADTVKLLSTFASAKAAGGGAPAAMPAMAGGGGCCGGACGCG